MCSERTQPSPPHGFRCRRSHPMKIRVSGNELTANLTNDPLVIPRNVQQGETLHLSRHFSRQMVTLSRPSWLFVLTVVGISLPAWSAISTSTPSPPLQWLNITGSLSGSSAPPLKGASIGYDETTRTLVVFGGESESGFPTSTTYLCVQLHFSGISEANMHRAYSLNLDSLIWSVPTPPSGLDDTPPARSNAISGFDMAANQRQCHIVIGGRGSDGSGLSDIWVGLGWLTFSLDFG